MPPPTSKLKAWDIYSKELRDLGFGHPLWVPEPSPEAGEVQLGDVGYLSQGKFCFLFNCMRDADHPVNRKGVPEGFKVFVPPDGPVEESAKSILNCIMDRMLVSGHARATNLEASASICADPVAHAEGAVSYRLEQQTGACLALKRPAHQTSLHCTEAIFRYLAAHYKEWRAFAIERRGRMIDTQRILFVSGFVKTAAWAVGAFRHGSSSATLKIDAGAMFGGGPSASVGAAISITDCSQPMSFHRNGPTERLPWEEGVSHPDDQCIFLQYAHLKYRFCRAFRGVVIPDDEDLFELPSESSSPNMSHVPIPLREYQEILDEEGVGQYSDSSSSEDEDDPMAHIMQPHDNVELNMNDVADDTFDDDFVYDNLPDDLDVLLDTDDDAIDEEALDYILQHGQGLFAGATSQDIYKLRQARLARDVSPEAAMWELIPGLEPVMLDMVFSEERSEVVGGKECLVAQVLSPSIGTLPP